MHLERCLAERVVPDTLTTVMRRFAHGRLRALLGAPAAPTHAFAAWLGDTPVGAVELFLGSDAAGLHDRVALLASTEGAALYGRRGFEEVARVGYYYRSFQNGAARGRSPG